MLGKDSASDSGAIDPPLFFRLRRLRGYVPRLLNFMVPKEHFMVEVAI